MSALRLPTGLLEEVPPFRSASLSEPTLFRGYSQEGVVIRPVVRAEACACGGVLEQHLGEDVGDLVEAHNKTERHDAWSLNTRWIP